TWHRVTLVPKGGFLTSAWAGPAGTLQVKVAAKDEVETALKPGQKSAYRIVRKDIRLGPQTKPGAEVGTVTVADVDGFEATVPVVALTGVDDTSSSKAPIVTYGLAIALISGAWYVRRRVKQAL
ncbi:MAG TPA: hypothetical protein VNI20_10965, partial [Fimbriimonadaceae bacterium]|nr:hypothetical protein [Fimbriimonadaceae bacterium]